MRMRRGALPAALGLAAAVLAAGCGGGGDGGNGPQNFPSTALVTAGATTPTFTPGRVDIRAGGTVRWTFGELAHNVQFSAPNAPANVATTSDGQAERTFPEAGSFSYECGIHQGMTGSVVVH